MQVQEMKMIQTIAKSTPTAEIVLTAFACRERDRAETNLVRFYQDHREELGLDEKDYYRLFKELSGCMINGKPLGQLIIGRNGKPNRFKWFYRQSQIGAFALKQPETRVKEFKARRKLPTISLPKAESTVKLVAKPEVLAVFKQGEMEIEMRIKGQDILSVVSKLTKEA